MSFCSVLTNKMRTLINPEIKVGGSIDYPEVYIPLKNKEVFEKVKNFMFERGYVYQDCGQSNDLQYMICTFKKGLNYKSNVTKINESQLRNIIKEAINELDWKTYANAAKKAKEWREKNPYKYDRNRGMSFDRAAVNAFNKQHDIDNLPNFGGERGNINFRSDNGNVELSGSRDHDFGYDKSGMLNHNVTHLSKQYGKDGKYGRTRMWDRAYETTPEEFYDDEEMATKFINAEKDVEDFNSGKYSYDNKKGWHLKESKLSKIIKENIKNVLKETDTLSYDQELQPGWYVCIEGNYGDVSVWVTDDLNEVMEVLDSSESNVMGPYNTEIEANEVADQETEKYGETNGFYRSDNKLTESKLRKIIKESVKKILRENKIDTTKRWWTVWVTIQSPNDYDHSSRVMYITKASTKEIAEDWAEELCYRKYHGCGAEHYYAHATPSTSEDFARYKKGDRFETD